MLSEEWTVAAGRVVLALVFPDRFPAAWLADRPEKWELDCGEHGQACSKDSAWVVLHGWLISRRISPVISKKTEPVYRLSLFRYQVW